MNLTKTPDLSELYPHVSPDGTKVCFIVEEGSAHGGDPQVFLVADEGFNPYVGVLIVSRKSWTEHAASLRTALDRDGWDGQWYRRGYYDDGTPEGKAKPLAGGLRLLRDYLDAGNTTGTHLLPHSA